MNLYDILTEGLHTFKTKEIINGVAVIVAILATCYLAEVINQL